MILAFAAMKLTRRTFFKVAGAAGATGLAGRETDAAVRVPGANARAMLVDTTRCVGCRSCEAACAEVNGLPTSPDATTDARRTTDAYRFTVVNEATAPAPDGSPRFAKTQCFHCVDPSCASACLVQALEKTPAGPVVYHPDRCLGCRYCMVACPFDAPKYEYDRPIPYVKKCEFCVDRQQQGLAPACVEACPTGALQFGTRAELLEEARFRIYQNPDRYVRHIYGEHEVGGTSWLYLADVPFETLGLREEVGTDRYPQFTWPFLSAVPLVLTLWPPFLMGLYAFTRARGQTPGGAPQHAEAAAGESEAHHE